MRTTTVVRAAMGLVGAALVSGCATVRTGSALPAYVTFASARPFTFAAARPFVVQQLSDPTVRCEVQRAEVQLGAIRGDTVLFTALVSHSQAGSAPPCALAGPGIIDLRAHPQVEAQMPRSGFARDALTAFGVVGSVLGAVILYSVFKYGLYST